MLPKYKKEDEIKSYDDNSIDPIKINNYSNNSSKDRLKLKGFTKYDLTDKEFEEYQIIYSSSLSLKSAVLEEFILNHNNSIFTFIGSGGSFSVAKFGELLHSYFLNSYSISLTPLTYLSTIIDKPSGSVFISASGRNKDIIASYKKSRLSEGNSAIIITGNAKSKLNEEVKKNKDVRTNFVVEPLFHKIDKFLAFKSIIGISTLLLKAYENIKLKHSLHNVKILNSSTEYPKIPLPRIYYKSREISSNSVFRNNYCIILYSQWSSPAAFDLESKLSEGALIASQLCDHRNFGHGRHNWLNNFDKETLLIVFRNAFDFDLVNKTIDLIPTSVDVLVIDTDLDGPIGGLSLLLGTFWTSRSFADIKKINIDKPGIPDFGRKLYHLSSLSIAKSIKTTIESNKTELWIKRKFPRSKLSQSFIQIAQNKLCKFIQNLTSENFNAVVFDFDGTLVSTSKRNNPINEDISGYLNKLLEFDIPIGIATGRGKSVLNLLKTSINEQFWDKVLIAYHNGSTVSNLNGESFNELLPILSNPQIELTKKGLLKIHNVLKKIDVSEEILVKLSETQISIRLKNGFSMIDFIPIVIEFLDSAKVYLDDYNLKFLTSGHSIDILPINHSKNNLINQFSSQNESWNILRIGDQGNFMGNDFEMLDHIFGLSVDIVSKSLLHCWNLLPSGVKGIEGTLHYLSKLDIKDKRFKVKIIF